MGLGPPVCMECMIVCLFNKDKHMYICPLCGDNLPTHYLFELEEKDQKLCMDKLSVLHSQKRK